MIVQEEFDNQALAQSEFEEYIDQVTETIAPEIEIDSVPDEFGELYRVWNSYHLLGTFYQNLEGKWVAQPCNTPLLSLSGRAIARSLMRQSIQAILLEKNWSWICY